MGGQGTLEFPLHEAGHDLSPLHPDSSNPPLDFQPECGQPGAREAVVEEERDEDDDL